MTFKTFLLFLELDDIWLTFIIWSITKLLLKPHKKDKQVWSDMRVNRRWQTSLYLFSLFDSVLLHADAITVFWQEWVFWAVLLNLHPHRSRSATRPGSARLHRNHPGTGLEEAQGQDRHLQASVRLCRWPTRRSRAACYRSHLHPERLEPWHALHRHPRGRTRAEEKRSCYRHRFHRWEIPRVKLIVFVFVQHDNVNVLFSGVDNKDCVVKLIITNLYLHFFPKYLFKIISFRPETYSMQEREYKHFYLRLICLALCSQIFQNAIRSALQCMCLLLSLH